MHPLQPISRLCFDVSLNKHLTETPAGSPSSWESSDVHHLPQIKHKATKLRNVSHSLTMVIQDKHNTCRCTDIACKYQILMCKPQPTSITNASLTMALLPHFLAKICLTFHSLRCKRTNSGWSKQAQGVTDQTECVSRVAHQ